MNLLELDDLCVAYDTPHGRRTVVDGLSLALPFGFQFCWFPTVAPTSPPQRGGVRGGEKPRNH